MKEAQFQQIQGMIERAAACSDATDALKWSQAALNAANAQSVMQALR